MKRAFWAVPIAAIVVAVLWYGFGRDPENIATPLIHHPAPSFNLTRIDGGRVDMKSLRGRPVVLNFWATWCGACHTEHSALVDGYRRWGKHVAFVGVVFEDSSSAARSFLHQYGGGWPNLSDPGRQTAIDYGVYKLPETFFIDRHGVIVAKQDGPLTDSILRRRVRSLLGGGQA